MPYTNLQLYGTYLEWLFVLVSYPPYFVKLPFHVILYVTWFCAIANVISKGLPKPHISLFYSLPELLMVSNTFICNEYGEDQIQSAKHHLFFFCHPFPCDNPITKRTLPMILLYYLDIQTSKIICCDCERFKSSFISACVCLSIIESYNISTAETTYLQPCCLFSAHAWWCLEIRFHVPIGDISHSLGTRNMFWFSVP
jgi:hypothetical protein